VLGFEVKFNVDDGIKDMIENINRSGLQFDPTVHGNAKYPYK